MTIVGISMVRDETDIVASTVSRMAAQVDHLLIADNGSTDATREILESLDGVTVVDDPETAYFQSRKMTALGALAREEFGAEWLVAFDADECWAARSGERLADVLSALPNDILIATADLYDYVATGVDPAEELDPVKRIAWRRRDPTPLPKVAVRALPGLTIHQGNHGASFEGIPHPPTVSNLLRVAHFPYRNVAQLVRKVRNGGAAYAAAGDAIPADYGAHWRRWHELLNERGEAAIAELFERWYFRETPDVPVNIEGEKQSALVYDPVAT